MFYDSTGEYSTTVSTVKMEEWQQLPLKLTIIRHHSTVNLSITV